MKILSGIILVFLIGSLSYLMFGKLGIPEGLSAVKGFNVQRFQGTWYEIARLDHGFEKGMSHVTAEYNAKNTSWETSTAKVGFIDGPESGRLKVSFFGPFYGSYNIIDLDEKDYSYAMITGPSKRFFWILAKKPQLEDAIMQRLIQKALAMGFKLEKLILVDQKEETAPKETILPMDHTNP